MARYSLFVLKVPLNPNQPTNQRSLRSQRRNRRGAVLLTYLFIYGVRWS